MSDTKKAAFAVWSAFASRDAGKIREVLTEDVKWLGQVIVGAGIDTLDALHPSAARGQKDNRRSTPRRTPVTKDPKTVTAWQSEVKDYGIVFFSVA